MLGEVFDHVIAFGFAVNQHVQTEALLSLYGIADFTVHGIGVFAGRQLALFVRLTRQTNRSGLREGADGCGRKRWQVQARTLHFNTFGKGRLTLAVSSRDGLQARLHRRFMDARRVGTAVL